MARMAKAIARVASSTTNEPECGTTKANDRQGGDDDQDFDFLAHHRRRAHSRPNRPVGLIARIRTIGA